MKGTTLSVIKPWQKLLTKIDSMDVDEKLNNMEKRLTDLVIEISYNATKTTCNKV